MWWHTVTHRRRSKGETGEWSGYPVLITLPRNMVYPVLLPLMNTPRLPVVDWTDAPADLNKLVRFAERRNLVSERVPSHFKRSLPRNWTDAPADLNKLVRFTERRNVVSERVPSHFKRSLPRNWTDAPADLNKLVRFTERRNVVSECVPSHFKRSLPRNWTDAPADLNKLVRFAERRNLVSERVPSHFKRSLPRNSPLKSAISKLCPKLTALVEVSPYNRLNRRTFLGYANGIKISFRGNLGFCERRSAPTVPWHCD